MERDFITTFEIGKYLSIDTQYLILHSTRTCVDQAGGIYLWYKPFIQDLNRYFRERLIKYHERTPSTVEWACKDVKSKPSYELWTPRNRKWFTISEISERTGLTTVNIIHAIKMGDLQAESIHSTLTNRVSIYLVNDDDLLDWINRRNKRALEWSGRGRSPKIIIID